MQAFLKWAYSPREKTGRDQGNVLIQPEARYFTQKVDSTVMSSLTEHELPGQLGGQHLAVVGEVAGVRRRRVVDQPLGRLRRLQLTRLRSPRTGCARGWCDPGAVGALVGGLVHRGDRLRAHQRGGVETHLRRWKRKVRGYIFTSSMLHEHDGRTEPKQN